MDGPQNYQRSARPKVFDLHILTGSSSQAGSAWISRHCNAEVKGEVDKQTQQLQNLLDELSEGDSPEIDSYLFDWGLSVKAAASLTRNHAIRLTAACHVIADNVGLPSCTFLRLDMMQLCVNCCIEPWLGLQLCVFTSASIDLEHCGDFMSSWSVQMFQSPIHVRFIFASLWFTSSSVFGVIPGMLAPPPSMFTSTILIASPSSVLLTLSSLCIGSTI